MHTVFLPLFPLRLVAFPGEALNLHIFEPRYKQLVAECEGRGITFGIPAFFDDKVQDIATEIELLSIDKRHPNGDLDIRTRALGPVKIEEFFPTLETHLYPGGLVKRLEFEEEGDFLLYEKILGLLGELYEVLNIHKPLPTLSEEFNTFSIGHLVGFNLEQEYELLTIASELTRQVFMLEHLDRLIPTAREMETLRNKVQMNGHFKNVLPPDFNK